MNNIYSTIYPVYYRSLSSVERMVEYRVRRLLNINVRDPIAEALVNGIETMLEQKGL